MRQEKIAGRFKNVIIAFFVGSILGAISFITIYGVKILNVTYVDWLMNSEDITQHYLGWAYFRNEPWSFPLGIIQSFGYPFGVSIVYTDSIPLFALLFKLFNPILPRNFQYFGIWGLISFILQGGISSIIFRKYSLNYMIIGISSLFIIFSPIMIMRMFGHTSLAGHWILLLALAVWVYKDSIQQNKKIEIALWSVICGLSVLIHPYLTAMVFTLLIGYLLHDFLNSNKIKKNISILATSIFLTVVLFWLVGGFIRGGNVSTGDFGFYSLNGNALFNPQGWSRYLKDLPLATGGQYEGFLYLGLGTILLIVINLSLLVFKNINYDKSSIFSVSIICIFLFVWSLSNTITFNDKILLTVPLPDTITKLFGVFRATGRFMWPVFYLLTFAAIINLIKNKISNIRLLILLLCIFIVQYTDLYPNIKYRNLVFNQKVNYESPLKSNFWTDAANNIKNITVIPPTTENYEHFSWLAVNHGLTLNSGYIARAPIEDIERYATKKLEQIMEGNASPKDLYIVWGNATEKVLGKCDDGLVCAFIDGYIVAYSSQTSLTNNYDDAIITSENISFENYLTHLTESYENKDYLILASVRDESTGSLSEELANKMKQFGMSENLLGKYRWSYIWAKSAKNGEILVESLKESLIEYHFAAGQSIAGQLLNSDITVRSAGLTSGDTSEIIIDQVNYSLDARGMNFVVYDVVKDQVIELASFDLSAKTDGIMIKLPISEG